MNGVTMKELKEQTNSINNIDNLMIKLSHIQNELKAPKNQFNKFGNYKYRSCEDILEALKPICAKYRTTLTILDDIEVVGDRFYIKSIARLNDWDSERYIEGIAYARESLEKKGMDSSQVTGATSSYARKYALNGLFNIDDTKDFDTDEAQNQQNQLKSNQKQKQKQYNPTPDTMQLVVAKVDEAKKIGISMTDVKITKFIDDHNNGKHKVNEMNESELKNYINVLDVLIKGKQQKNVSNS